MAPSHSPAATTTSFLVGNLHCPTCVSAIQDALKGLQGIRWVSPNVVTSWITVEHEPGASIMQMASRLEEAGFELSSINSADGEVDMENYMGGDTANLVGGRQPTSSADVGQLDGTVDYISKKYGKLTPVRASAAKAEHAKTHLNNCKQCQTTASNPYSSCINGALVTSHGRTSEQDTVDKNADGGMIVSTSSLATVDNEQPISPSPKRSWRASLAVGGMTCAACSNTIQDELSKRDWITKITVNLISNSATIEYVGDEGDASRVVESIEDLGYEANIDQVVSLDDEVKSTKHERTVEISIDGFYCQHCAQRTAKSLAVFGHKLSVVNQPTQQRPIIKVTYIPEVPTFTVRTILAAIDASDPAFKASIYHPPTLEERSKRMHAQHQKQILFRVILTFIIATPTFIIGIVYMSLLSDHGPGKMFLMAPWASGISRAQIALFIMATPVYFFAADIFHRRAVKEIKSLWRPGSRTPILQRFYRFGSMNMLMSLGTTVAYVSSVSQMIAAAADRSQQVKDSNFYFDSVVFLTLFLLVGRLIEAYSKSKTGSAVEALGKLRPTTAILVQKGADKNSTDSVVQTDLLEFGDTVRIPHGSSPPCDGRIIHGETVFDESSLTGESRPIKKRVGDEVYSGTVNMSSPILVRITGVAGQSMLDKIVNVVREGQTKRAPVEKVADLLTAYFVPVVTLIAILTWIIWLSAGLSGAVPGHFLESSGGWVAFSLQFAIAVFVVACPCGLALAAPTAIFVGGGLAAKHGILVKGGGEAFEKASRIDCVVFDKTGTLTTGGEPSITDSMIFPGQDVNAEQRSRLLSALRAVEENSSHPIAKAIVSFCSAQTPERITVTEVMEIPGKGLKATCSDGSPGQGFDIIVGNEALMKDFTVPIPSAVASSLQTWKTEAKSVVLVATKSTSPSGTPSFYTVAAALSVSDPIRPETSSVIQALRAKGTDVWMLSGDNIVTARAVALRVGIPETNVIAEVLPTQKYDKITYLQSTLKARRGRGSNATEDPGGRRATIAMVGDGINDAPALSTADVGIAIGSGSDVAISSADFVLVNSNLGSVVTLLDLSASVFRRIKFNFAWALVYNLVALPVAAGCLYPIVVRGEHVRLDPVWASLAMALSSVSVVLSSLALRTRVPWLGFRVRSVKGVE
ncbi:Uu.00g129480.m01.CDS01 [Anthostomella pinea]|uniref:Uu.00g129480.m01.CDS01 n=1 Tax=Anthostomella pinea TaxID=933095 RepID=A0AAI8VIH0_9PEZI|nr:Uu.00g129480.m01.CDS01 [Anthostomella pinea]